MTAIRFLSNDQANTWAATQFGDKHQITVLAATMYNQAPIPTHQTVICDLDSLPDDDAKRSLLAELIRGEDAADALNVSVKTIETHRKQVMDKLDLHSVAELTKYAIRHGLTTLD